MNAWHLVIISLAVASTAPAMFLRGRKSSVRPRPKAEFGPVLLPLWWAARAYCRLWHRLPLDGWAPLPPRGPAILIANHTCCIDHLLIQSRSRRVLGYMIARDMYELPVVHHFCVRTGCIPVDRDGRDLRAMRSALRALEDGRVVPIFPEGRISPEGGRTLGAIRSGAAFLALRSGVPVVPAFLSGTPETIEIGPSLRRRSRSRVLFGPPVDLSDFDASQAGNKDVLARVSQRFERALRELQARSLGLKTSEESADEGSVE